MLRVDCGACPRRDDGCEGCFVEWMLGENVQVTGSEDEPCGYVLDEGICDAIEILREVGLVDDLRILEMITAA